MNVNQNHSGIGDNIVNLAPEGRHLTAELESDLLNKLPEGSRVTVFSYTGDREALDFATEIAQYLKSREYVVGMSSGDIKPIVYGLAIRPAMRLPRFLNKNNIDPGYMLIVGYKK